MDKAPPPQQPPLLLGCGISRTWTSGCKRTSDYQYQRGGIADLIYLFSDSRERWWEVLKTEQSLYHNRIELAVTHN